MSNLTSRCSFRVTDDEKKEILNNAASLSLKESEYLRKKVLEKPNDPVKILLELRDKYILEKYNVKKDITSQQFIELKIKGLNEVINNLINYLQGKDIEF